MKIIIIKGMFTPKKIYITEDLDGIAMKVNVTVVLCWNDNSETREKIE